MTFSDDFLVVIRFDPVVGVVMFVPCLLVFTGKMISSSLFRLLLFLGLLLLLWLKFRFRFSLWSFNCSGSSFQLESVNVVDRYLIRL